MDLIEEFFDKKLITNHNTRKSYRTNINKYFKLIKKDINTYLNHNLDVMEKDLESAYKQMKTKGTSDIVIKTTFNSVKQFLCKMKKGCKELEFWDDLKDRTRSASPITEDNTPNTFEIKKVLQHSNTRVELVN